VVIVSRVDADMVLTRLDASGNTLWTNRVIRENTQTSSCVKEMANGDLVVCGSEDGSPKGYAFRTRADGTLIWAKALIATHPYIMRLNEWSSGNIQLCGVLQDTVVETVSVELTATGNMVQARRLNPRTRNSILDGGGKLSSTDRQGRSHIVGRLNGNGPSAAFLGYWTAFSPSDTTVLCDQKQQTVLIQDFPITFTRVPDLFADSLLVGSPYALTSTPYGPFCVQTTCQAPGAPERFLGGDRTVCQVDGSPVVLDASSRQGTYVWSTGQSDARITVFQPGRYWVRVTGACGVVSDTVQVRIQPRPPRLSAQELNLCAGDTAALPVPTQPGIRYRWTPEQPPFFRNKDGAAFIAAPWAVSAREDDYHFHLRITDSASLCPGADDSLQVRVWAKGAYLPTDGYCTWRPPFIPNIFTPGRRDAANDAWVLTGMEQFPLHTLTLYTSHGRRIHQASPYRNDWTAEDLPAGVYYYHIQVQGGQVSFKGWVEVVK